MDFLDAERNKQKLSDAGLFLLVYEALNLNVTQRTRDFFLIIDLKDEYKKEVLSRAKHEYEASVRWLIEMGALAATDLPRLLALREYRNSVAHQIPEYIFNSTDGIETSKIVEAAEYAKRIDNYWTNIEVDINPAFDNQEIDRENVQSVFAEAVDVIVSMHLTLHSTGDG